MVLIDSGSNYSSTFDYGTTTGTIDLKPPKQPTYFQFGESAFKYLVLWPLLRPCFNVMGHQSQPNDFKVKELFIDI